MNAIVYKVTCLTNLHVGNGEANFDIIDNTVEKDPVTGLPTINSSGVKGALRQYFEEKGVDKAIITRIFGTDANSSKKNENSTPGKVKFYQADLIARPVRASKGDAAYYMATSLDALNMYNLKMQIFGGTVLNVNGIKEDVNYAFMNGIGAEDIAFVELLMEDNISSMSLVIDNGGIVVLKNSTLKDMPLPVLARNQLDDKGISKNLWYEEVVPHKSIFTFAVSSEDSLEDKDVLNSFSKNMTTPQYIQFGGNASIGYGLCKVEEIFSTVKEAGEQV